VTLIAGAVSRTKIIALDVEVGDEAALLVRIARLRSGSASGPR
jgi:hypothetical protein